jgi:hypothetical protein
MGGGLLKVRLKSDRVRVQDLRISAAEGDSLQKAADKIAELRVEPSVESEQIGYLTVGSNRAYGIVGRHDEWVKLAFDGGGGGWTSVSAFCTGPCRSLLDVGNYANELVAVARGRQLLRMPEKIAPEARILAHHLAAKLSLQNDPEHALEILETIKKENEGRETFGATDYANLWAMASVSNALLKAKAEQAYDSIHLSPELIGDIADRLAHASVEDPGDLTTLENLAVLFQALGDKERETLAAESASSLKSPSKQPRRS